MRTHALAGLLGAVVAACAPAGAATPASTAACCDPTAPAVELTIYAAASLKGALEEATEAYGAENPGITFVISTDSSSALETKIEQGAPADVFLSADTTNARKLFDGGWAAELPAPFAGSELTVIVPSDNPGGLASPADLANDGVDVIAAGDEVPITRYATQLVRNLAAVAGYPASFEAAYAANVASKEENVKAVVAKIELGQGDAAIVYVTDAKASAKLATLAIPPGANVSATYAGIVVKASPHAGAARAFLAWFAGADGQSILGRFGFLPPPA